MKLDLLWHMLSFQLWNLLQAANPTGHVPAGSPCQHRAGQGDNRQRSAASRFQQGSSGQGRSQQHYSGSPSQQSRAGQEASRQPPQHGGSNHLRRTAAANAAGAAADLAASQSPEMQQRQECVRQPTGPAGEDNVRHCDTVLRWQVECILLCLSKCYVTPQM